MAKAKQQTTITLSIRIATSEKAALAKAAKAEDRSAAYLARRFIVDGLKASGFLK